MSLHLFSTASRDGKLSGCDLSFQIPRPIQNLSESEYEDEMTPFRDRLMIEKLFGVPTAQNYLATVIKSINEELEERGRLEALATPGEDTRSPERWTLCVGISCLKGTQTSPCFVEKLYEMYRFRPPIENLTVKREHKNAFSFPKHKNPSKDKRFLWQHTMLSVKYLHGLKDLSIPKLWQPFPFHMLSVIEEHFIQNPLSQQLEIRYSQDGGTYSLNFETGEMYDSHEKKMYRFRCVAVSIDNRLSCRMLEDSTYKRAVKGYGAAGILFYAFHPITGETVFLLGHMTYSSRSWCDFGGFKSFRESPRETASRECAEETFGVLGGSQHLLQLLKDYQSNNVFKVVNLDTHYVSHFVRVSYNDYPSHFRERLLDDDLLVEIDELRWFSFSSLESLAEKMALGYTNLFTFPIFEDGNTNKQTPCPIRYEFLQTFWIARKLNILHSIQHITKRLYLQQQQVTNSGIPEGKCLQPAHKSEVGIGIKPEVSHDSHDNVSKSDTRLGEKLEPHRVELDPKLDDKHHVPHLDGGTGCGESEVVCEVEATAPDSAVESKEQVKEKPQGKKTAGMGTENTCPPFSCGMKHCDERKLFQYGMGEGRIL